MSKPAGAPENRRPSLLYSVKRLELAIRARLDDMLKDAGVTTLQYTALTVLARRSGLSASQLARDSFVTPQSMADMLRLLEARGLVVRSGNARNRRESLVQITDAGQALLQAYAEAAASLEERLTSGLLPEDRARFGDILQTAWDTMR